MTDKFPVGLVDHGQVPEALPVLLNPAGEVTGGGLAVLGPVPHEVTRLGLSVYLCQLVKVGGGELTQLQPVGLDLDNLRLLSSLSSSSIGKGIILARSCGVGEDRYVPRYVG
jgi:hypothetical protein